jgi:hypothetical protein
MIWTILLVIYAVAITARCVAVSIAYHSYRERMIRALHSFREEIKLMHGSINKREEK